ncbi:MAG: 30S ribosomal protein S6 [Polyangiaceae bacterium]|nr:30S ribosomal protein S6 [Polyangiaceae bacterium]
MSRAATAPNRAREYETIYILKPDIDAEAAERVGSRLAEVVGRESGQLTKVETWGRRKLAYAIAKQRRGVYVYLKYLGSGRVVSELERNLRLFDGVLKYQTVLVRSDVEVDGISVAAEDVTFERLELPPLEEDKEDSRERQLGLVESERREKPEGVAELDEGEIDAMGEMGADEDEET